MNNNKINLPCYDTLVMTHKFNDYEESVQYIDLIEKVLDNPQKNTNKITGQLKLEGYILGMKIMVNVNTIDEVVILGSLCKSYFGGSNLFSMTLDEIEQHLRKLANILKLPLLDAEVKRIDIGTSLLMQNQPENYFNALGGSSRCERWTRRHSLYYVNSYKTLIFYNKLTEMKKKEGVRIDGEQYSNILRYELRYFKDIADKFNTEKIKVKDLYDIGFFDKLVNRWVREYEKINKNRLFEPSNDKLTSGDAIDYTLSAIITHHGQNNLNMITDNLEDKFKNIAARSRYYQKLRSLKFLSKESELITELTGKILEAKNNTLLLNRNNILEEAIY